MRVAIVGTRKPAPPTRAAASWAAKAAVAAGYEVVTGGAEGVDAAAVATVQQHAVVVVPWRGFGSCEGLAGRVVVYDPRRQPEWAASVDRLHPAPERLGSWARRLLARDYGVVDMARAVIAFPRRGGRGGTWQAIRAAHALGRPVLVLPDPVDFGDAQAAVATFLESLRGPGQGWRG